MFFFCKEYEYLFYFGGYFMFLLFLLLVQVRFQFYYLEIYCKVKRGVIRENKLKGEVFLFFGKNSM